MKRNLNREQHFSPVDTRSNRRPKKSYGRKATLAILSELAGISTPDELSQSTALGINERQEEISREAAGCAVTAGKLEKLPALPVLAEAHPESNNGEATNAIPKDVPGVSNPQQRRSKVNDLFADLLYGDRINDSSLQRDVLSKFRPVIQSAAHKTGYLEFARKNRSLCDGDWQSTGHFCLTKEVLKFRHVSLHEIDKFWNANKFAYIWKALADDFKDEMRKIRRRPEVFLGDDGWEIVHANRQTETECSDSCAFDSKAELFQQVGKLLSDGPAATLQAIAKLRRDPKELSELTAPELSDRATKTLIVKHVAESRGVGTQVVRKNIRQIKEYVRELLRQNIVPGWRHRRIAASAAVALQAGPVLATSQSALSQEDTASRAWGPKCVICNTRLHNEGDFCSVCVPGDEERKFQVFSHGTKRHDVASREIDLVGEDISGDEL